MRRTPDGMRTLAVFLALTGPAAAQTSVAPAEFLDRVTPGTIVFTDTADGSLVGVEEFLEGRRSFYAHWDGRCTVGRITTDDAQLCFHYDDGSTHCWWPFERDGVLHARSVDDPTHVQRAEPTTEVVRCEGRPTS